MSWRRGAEDHAVDRLALAEQSQGVGQLHLAAHAGRKSA